MNHLALALVLGAVATSGQEYIAEKKPTLVHITRPCYTQAARQAKVEGVVVLSVEVHPDGRAHSISVKRSLEPGLDASAIEAVKQWRFNPGEKHGEPLTVPIMIEVNFRLDDPTQRCVSTAEDSGDRDGRSASVSKMKEAHALANRLPIRMFVRECNRYSCPLRTAVSPQTGSGLRVA